MNSRLILISIAIILIGSCKSRKSSSLRDANISKVNFTNVLEEKSLVWSQLSAVANIEKLKVGGLNSDDIPGGIKIYFRMENNELIWASIRSALLGVEAARVKITRDSVYLLNKFDKTYSIHSVDRVKSYVPGISGISELQKLLLGQNLFDATTYSWVNSESLDSFYLFHKDDHMKNSLNGQRKSGLVSESLISDNNGEFDAKILYSEYEAIDKKPVPFIIDFNAQHKEDDVKILIKYEKVEKKEDLTFPFTIPSSYEKL
jgi:hypothetical protein